MNINDNFWNKQTVPSVLGCNCKIKYPLTSVKEIQTPEPNVDHLFCEATCCHCRVENEKSHGQDGRTKQENGLNIL